MLLVTAGRPDLLAALAHDDRRAGVLAHRQHAACSDIRVLQQVEGDEAVIRAGLRILENSRELGEVTGAEQVGDIAESLEGEEPQGLGLDMEDGPTVDLGGSHPIGRDEPVLRGVRAEREQVLVFELSHCSSVDGARRPQSRRISRELR